MAQFRYSVNRQVNIRWLAVAIVCGVVACIVVGLLAGLVGRPNCEDTATPQPEVTTRSPEVTTRAPEVTTGSPEVTTTAAPEPWQRMRLPAYQVPLHYRVRLRPTFGNDTPLGYSGQVDIRVRVATATDLLLVHRKFLEITNTTVVADNGTQLPISDSFNYDPNQFWVIRLASSVAANSTLNVSLSFLGNYSGIVGLYNSSYVENGVTRHLATTKFQPTDARKAFPCLDEPQLKAPFSVELVHPPNYTALSNMPLQANVSLGDNLILSTFEETPPMSTYLFCILISQFGKLNGTSRNGKPFNVWAPESRIGQAQYSLDAGIKIQDDFSQQFDSDYDLQMPKQDMAAIPDFPSGAMEHWGLITYRDTAMLFDNSSGSAVNQQRVVVVVAHELAHMWFGNLVTMKWWNDLWLNEGFASFYAYRGAALVETEWDLEEQGIAISYTSAFNADDAISSHPIIVDVETPQEITQIFDTITYSKGQAVITQLEDFVGKENFLNGLREYLEVNKYGVATTTNLYSALQNHTELNVTEFMDRWTMQMGFPLLTVSAAEGSDVITVSQAWYLRDNSTRSRAPPSPYNYEWIVKLTYALSNGSQRHAMLNTASMNITVAGHAAMSPPLKLNLGQKGFCRVTYPDSWWQRIGNALINNVTSYQPLDRSGLVGDAFAVALSNQLDYSVVLRLIRYMANERHYLPWRTASASINYITTQLQRRGSYGRWMNFLQNITSGAYNALQFDPQTGHLERLLQPIVLSLACKAGNPDCLAESQKLFKAWRENNTSVNAELRSTVYTYGLLADDTESTWNFLWQKYSDSATAAAEKERLLAAMSATKNSWLISRLLQRSQDRQLVRSQDFATLIGYIGANPNALDQLWAWSRANWDNLLKEFGNEDRRVGAMIPNFARQFNDEFRLAEYEQFINTTQPGAGLNARQSALSQIRANVQWIASNEDELLAGL